MSQPAISPLPRMLEWIRPPQQERTRQALGRMLDAAEALVAEKGFDDAGIAEIAQRSDSSVGGFYRRFEDKQGLLQALHERFCAEARATAEVALDPVRWAGASVVEIINQFTAFLVQIYREREGLFRAFLLCGSTDAAVRERTQLLFQFLAQRLNALLDRRREEIRHPDPELAASAGLQVLIGTLNHVVLVQPPALGLSDERLPTELGRVFVSYLGAGTLRTIPKGKRISR